MTRRRSVTALVVALLTALAVTSAAEAATKTVYAGPPFEKRPTGAPEFLDLNGFYRERVSVHVGDTVSWQFRGFHTVTFAGAQDAPPFVVPDPANPYRGLNDAAGAPFWFNGQPSLVLNPRAAAPSGGRATNGSAFRNSGLPPMEGRPKPYRLKFNRAGNFRYLCLVHPGMAGAVKVVSKRRAVPGARVDKAAALSEATRHVRHARRLAGFKPDGERVVAGHDRGAVSLFAFFPRDKSVKVGDTVEFGIDSRTEIHNVAFGPRAYRKRLADGIITPRPSASPGPPALQLSPLIFLPSDPPPVLPPSTGTNHGNGFLNTGALDTDNDSPNPPSSRITFTKAGTYQYECLIHPGMIGKINVR